MSDARVTNDVRHVLARVRDGTITRPEAFSYLRMLGIAPSFRTLFVLGAERHREYLNAQPITTTPDPTEDDDDDLI